MSNESRELQRSEARPVARTERTRTRPTYSPRSDVYETREAIVVVADMPGVAEDSVDITLEKNVLTIHGSTNGQEREGYKLSYGEFEVGDFERSFALPQETDRSRIDARVKNGVLHLTLPKSKEATARKIPVRAG
ncbi:MAG: Hsp20/alpha crystallin family protein [Candidatus Latescibacterota bacterium]